MGYKTKLLKRGEAGQQCKKHMPIGFSGKYTSRVKQENNMNNNMNNNNNNNNNNMEKWAVSAMCQNHVSYFLSIKYYLVEHYYC